jgi:hypothetical protein
MSTSAATPTTALTVVKDFTGGIIGSAWNAGNSVFKIGANATDVSVYGVPLLTVSMIAITSVIMAYVTIGQSDGDGGGGEETGFMNSMTNSYDGASSNISSQLGGKSRRKKRKGKYSRKTRRCIKK